MRTALALGALVLLLATVPAASAWQVYPQGPMTVYGFATSCTYVLTPIMGSFGWVFQNFAGTINSAPAAHQVLVVIPTSGTFGCLPFGGGFAVYGSGTATAFGGP